MTSLTLSRKLDESVVIFVHTEQIVITVEDLSKSVVKLNFEASEAVDIWRDELLEDEDS